MSQQSLGLFDVSRAVSCRRILDLPHVGQELPELLTRRLPNLRQHAGEVPLRIDAVPFATGDQRPEPGVVLGRLVVAGEEPVESAGRSQRRRLLTRRERRLMHGVTLGGCPFREPFNYPQVRG